MTMNWQCNGSECKKENVKTHPDEEVDHEEDVEGEVDLLGGVLHPRGACFHTIPESGDWTKSTKSESEDSDTNCLYFHFSLFKLYTQPIEWSVHIFIYWIFWRWRCQQDIIDINSISTVSFSFSQPMECTFFYLLNHLKVTCQQDDQFHFNSLATLRHRWSRWWETRWRGWRLGRPGNWNLINTHLPSKQ